jgi:membrane-associated protease RseP (regulator of RpoE activity)
MNLMLAVVFFAILIMGVGIDKPIPTISSVAKCTVSVKLAVEPSGKEHVCTAAETAISTPAAKAGLRAGDRFVSYNGRQISDYSQLQKLIRATPNQTVPAVVERDGKQIAVQIPVTANQLVDLKDNSKVVTAGFVGLTPLSGYVRGGPGDVVVQLGDMTTRTLESFAHLPQKMAGVWQAAFSGEKRDPNGPIGVVGASRLGGEILASESPVKAKFVQFLGLLASINFAVGMFNLIPLLPLDGGHMAGAIWEGIKRGWARIVKRPDPGYVDVAKLLPLTYAMSLIFLVMGALLVYADLINPIKFT